MDFRKTLTNKRKYIIIGTLAVSVVTIILGLGLGLGLQLQQCKNKVPESCRNRCYEPHDHESPGCRCDAQCVSSNSCCYDFADICLQPIESWDCTPLRCGEKRVSGSKCHCSSDCVSAGDCCTNYGIVCNGMTPWVQDQCVNMSPKCPSNFKRQPLLLISLDGLRAEYQHTWHSLIPVLDKLRRCGTSSAFMQPVFPSKTFPNHYSIVTGLYSESHGLVDNNMYDPVFNASFSLSNAEKDKARWYLGQPIWLTVMDQGLRAGTFFWPGSDVQINGSFPNIYEKYNGSIPFEQRVFTMLKWLQMPDDQRPDFYTLYLEEPDKSGHNFGPVSGGDGSLRGFTRDPSQLHGTMLRTALRKSMQGFGFTIIGGDRPDEFLQVKNVLRDGPAAQDNRIAPGDVIVDINGTCVLGKTHADVVQMFQSVAVNQYVDMVLCRGYPLPEDAGDEASGDAAVAPPAERQPLVSDGRQEDASELTLLQPELVSVTLAKGPNGFGFAIADCPLGQKVKMILDAQWCRGLLKGDVIKEINRKNVQTLSHTQVVDILKELPPGSEVNMLVLRGGQTSPVKSLKPCATAMPMPVTQKHEATTNTVSTDSPSPVESLPQTLPVALPQTLPVALPQSLPQAPPYSLPFPPNVVRSSSPKLDPSELYLKSKAILDSKPSNTKDLDVFIKRNQESGFGFRVLGGEGTDQPVYIGAIVPLGAAEKDGRLRAGDELMCIDGVPVKGKSHKQVLELMTNAARHGQVMLTVRRKLLYAEAREDDGGQSQATPPQVNGSPRPPHADAPALSQPEAYDVTLQRKDNEGFGFVILTSKNKPPPGVIPHKIGRIIKGSPTERSGKLKVGDRISAVNGQCIVELSHNDIVQLIKQAGNTVALTVLPEEEHSGPPSATSSAKQSPVAQHKAMGQQPASHDDGNGPEMQEREEGVARGSYKSLPKNGTGTIINSGPKQGCFPVELERGPRGFGFSLRGGKEYNMGLFILRLAEDGPALKDGRIHVGDQIVEINGEPTQGITHTRAIELIQAGGTKVLLLLRPGQGLIPDHNVVEMVTTPPANYPKYPVPDEPSMITSRSSPSLSPSEGTSAPSPSHGLHHQARNHREPRTSSSSISLRDNTPSPQKMDTSCTEGKERSHSPRKMEKKPSVSVKNKNVNASTQSLDVFTDRIPQGQRDRGGRSVSPRKSPRKEQETGTRQPFRGYEEPQRYSDGQHFNYGSGGDLYKEEDLDFRQDKETGETRPEIARSDTERRHRQKGVQREAAPQRSQSQILNDRAMLEHQPTTSNRKGHREPKEGRYRGGAGEESKRDTRGSSSIPPETSWNGNPNNKKAPITPGPWKVPSSAKMQSQVEGL